MRWRRWLVPGAGRALRAGRRPARAIRRRRPARRRLRHRGRRPLPGPSHLQAGLFDDPGFLPGHIAAKAVGLEDDLRYRRAVWLYARANPSNTTVYLSPAQEALRASLEPKLIDASRAETDPRRRSRLLNLLGVVAMSRYAVDPADRSNTVRAAIDSFTNAINTDPTNADAKFNLEIVLRDFFHQVAPASAPDRGRLGGNVAGVGRDGCGY